MVAVKGMKMPKGCWNCGFCCDNGGYYCLVNHNYLAYSIVDIPSERPKNCPLVEIVTCKDCKYCVMTEVGCYCGHHIHRLDTHIDKYCADAERRE